MEPAEVESAVGDLYARPLSGFVAARNELASRLRDAGEHDEARRVKALTKPSVAAWAVNQLAHAEPERIRDLFAIGERLKDAQRALLAPGAASPADHRTLLAEERRLIRALVDRAIEIAADNGRSLNATHREKIADTLAATASEDQVRDLTARGRLTTDARRAGLGLDGVVPDGAASPDDESDPGPTDPARTRAQAHRREREKALRAREKEFDRLTGAAERSSEAAAAAKAAAARARAAAERAKARVEEARRAVTLDDDGGD